MPETKMKLIEGKVWKFGDNIDTDLIVPGQYLDAEMDEVKKHVFENNLPEFTSEVAAGDVIVAGSNFGCGSSRENAPAALKELSVGCIIAESFGRIFFRNALAIGLPILAIEGVSSRFETGDQAVIDIENASVRNITQQVEMIGERLSPEMIRILNLGGILELLKEEMATQDQ